MTLHQAVFLGALLSSIAWVAVFFFRNITGREGDERALMLALLFVIIAGITP